MAPELCKALSKQNRDRNIINSRKEERGVNS